MVQGLTGAQALLPVRQANTASATSLTLPTAPMIAVYPITGTTTITSIAAGQNDKIAILEFASAGCQVTNGSNLKLAGNYVSIVQGTLTLESDGTNWNEIGRNDNHALAANVHGLPASVNVLGNKTAAGEFIQRADAGTITTGASSFPVQYLGAVGITFAVAFSATPYVWGAGTTTTGGHAMCIYAVTTSGAAVGVWGNGASVAWANCKYVALGS